MGPELLQILARLAMAASAAIVAALLLRRPLRQLAGADAAYRLWLIVPIAMLAAALPMFRVATVLVLNMAPALQASALVGQVAQAGTAWVDLVLLTWATGAFATLALLVLGQRAYLRSLGALTESDGLLFAEHDRHGPALLGLWRPVIVVPSDFRTRYNEREQALVIAHEKLHAQRRDPAANAVMALFQCVFWFNPLVHIAASRFRFDQELACDAGVLARAGGQRQDYAAAMLKTQSAGAPALATCHWQSSHPLKERIMQLKKNPPGALRRRAGHLAIALLACASVLGTVAARAEGSATGPYYEVSLDVWPGVTPRVRVKADTEFKVGSNEPGAQWTGTFRISPAKDNTVFLKTQITPENGKEIRPSLLLRLGEPGAVRVGAEAGQAAFGIGFTVKQVDSLVPDA
ncbi:MAG: M56 family metallopeptidase [Pseudomonadota bacterium]